MSINMPLCYCCAHLRSSRRDATMRCAAYPRGIPDKFIFGGDAMHTAPEDGDKGIQFAVGGNLLMSTKEAVETYNEVFLPLLQSGA